METLKLNISGMTCGGCARSVHTVIQALEGVATVEVDWQAGTAVVAFDSASQNAAAIIEAVENAGFDAAAA